jgi:hypothetical protein
MGRGDRRGAARLAYLVFALTAVAWLFAESHVPTLWEVGLFVMFISWALFVSGLLWLLYVSLEPFVRRHWPHTLVSWSRLLSGGVWDPLVGRDLLIGCALGAVQALLIYVKYPVASWIGVDQDPPFLADFGTLPLHVLVGVRAVIAVLALSAVWSVFWGLALLFLLFLFRVLLRNEWAAALVCLLTLVAAETMGKEAVLVAATVNVLRYAAGLFVLARFGPLALAASMMSFLLLTAFPITTDLSAWYSGIGLAGVCVLFGLAAFAFHTSLGGQPLFGRVSLGD